MGLSTFSSVPPTMFFIIDGNGGVMCILMCTLLGTEAGATL